MYYIIIIIKYDNKYIHIIINYNSHIRVFDNNYKYY